MEKLKLTASAKIIEFLDKNLENEQSLSDVCAINETQESIVILNEKKYEFPLRVGMLLDDIIRLQNASPKTKKAITFKNATLDTRQFIFTRTDGKSVSLTEKEAEILTHLHHAKPEHVQKNTLLSAVWGYAESVETHTLETHIYRLRKKIEIDPTKPEILITNENGYSVA